MNNLFLCHSSENIAWKVIDLVYNLVPTDQMFYIYVDKVENISPKLIPERKGVEIIDASSLSNLPPIDRLYSLEETKDNKNIINQIKPENVYFHNKSLSNKSKILSEEEVYYLKHFDTEMNLFTFQTIVALSLSIALKQEPENNKPTQGYSIILEDFLSNDEVFFWRKAINLLSKSHRITIFTTQALEDLIIGYGELPNTTFENIDHLNFTTSTHWICRDSDWKYRLNINEVKATIIYPGQFRSKDTTYGPRLTYLTTELTMQGFPALQHYFENINSDKIIPSTYHWDKELETWTRLNWAPLSFNELIFHVYFLYWNFYMREKEVQLKRFEFGPSVNQENLTHYMKSLVEIHNLMGNLKHLAQNKTEIAEFERILRHTNNSFVRILNADPLLAPVYTSFAVTNTASRDLTYDDIIHFYFKKADDIQLLTTVIFELLGSFSKQNKITINL